MNHQKPKGQRVNYNFMGTWPAQGELWWDPKARKWVPFDNDKELWSTAPCRSVKAFRKHLKRHPELDGIRMRLISWYEGHDVYATRNRDSRSVHFPPGFGVNLDTAAPHIKVFFPVEDEPCVLRRR